MRRSPLLHIATTCVGPHSRGPLRLCQPVTSDTAGRHSVRRPSPRRPVNRPRRHPSSPAVERRTPPVVPSPAPTVFIEHGANTSVVNVYCSIYMEIHVTVPSQSVCAAAAGRPKSYKCVIVARRRGLLRVHAVLVVGQRTGWAAAILE